MLWTAAQNPGPRERPAHPSGPAHAPCPVDACIPPSQGWPEPPSDRCWVTSRRPHGREAAEAESESSSSDSMKLTLRGLFSSCCGKKTGETREVGAWARRADTPVGTLMVLMRGDELRVSPVSPESGVNRAGGSDSSDPAARPETQRSPAKAKPEVGKPELPQPRGAAVPRALQPLPHLASGVLHAGEPSGQD